MSDFTTPHIVRHPNGRDWRVIGGDGREIVSGTLARCRQKLGDLLGHAETARRAARDVNLRRAINRDD